MHSGGVSGLDRDTDASETRMIRFQDSNCTPNDEVASSGMETGFVLPLSPESAAAFPHFPAPAAVAHAVFPTTV